MSRAASAQLRVVLGPLRGAVVNSALLSSMRVHHMRKLQLVIDVAYISTQMHRMGGV